MDEKMSVEKLQGPKNWATWKFQTEHLLKAKGLWSFTQDSTTVFPNDDTRRKAERAFSVIALNVASSQVYLITTCKSAYEAWDTLRKHFEKETLAIDKEGIQFISLL